jgi:transposase
MSAVPPKAEVSAYRHPYDKLAANYLAFVKLAAIRIWLRAYEPTP